MRIALLNDSFPPSMDGVANAVYNYASILKNQGDDPTVITPKYPNVTDSYPFSVVRYPSINIANIPFRVGAPLSVELIHQMNTGDFDIIHNHCPFASGVVARELMLKGKRKNVPVVFTYHTKFDIDIDRFVTNKKFNKISKKFTLDNIKISDEVWIVSKGAEESLRNLGYNGDVRVMENGTDYKVENANEDIVKEIRRKYALPEKIPILLFIGRMMWYKNIKLILDTYIKLKADGIPFIGVFVGDGPDRSAIEQYARFSGIYDRLIFTGAIYDRQIIKGFYSIADLFMFPSTFDTCGLVVKEAASAYCPSLLCKGSCASDGIEDGFTGLVAEEDADSMAKSVAAMLKAPDKLKEIGINASKYVYRSWEDTVSESKKEYERIIEKHSKKSKKHFR